MNFQINPPNANFGSIVADNILVTNLTVDPVEEVLLDEDFSNFNPAFPSDFPNNPWSYFAVPDPTGVVPADEGTLNFSGGKLNLVSGTTQRNYNQISPFQVTNSLLKWSVVTGPYTVGSDEKLTVKTRLKVDYNSLNNPLSGDGVEDDDFRRGYLLFILVGLVTGQAINVFINRNYIILSQDSGGPQILGVNYQNWAAFDRYVNKSPSDIMDLTIEFDRKNQLANWFFNGELLKSTKLGIPGGTVGRAFTSPGTIQPPFVVDDEPWLTGYIHATALDIAQAANVQISPLNGILKPGIPVDLPLSFVKDIWTVEDAGMNPIVDPNERAVFAPQNGMECDIDFYNFTVTRSKS